MSADIIPIRSKDTAPKPTAALPGGLATMVCRWCGNDRFRLYRTPSGGLAGIRCASPQCGAVVWVDEGDSAS